MRQITIAFLLISVLSLSACGQNPEDARKELGQMNIPYSEDTFIEAAGNGDIMAVKLFLRAGMNVNATAFSQQSALTAAVSRGRTEVVVFLLGKGADPNANGGLPLQQAAREGSVEIVRKLLENGATSNSVISLIAALNADHLEIAKLILAKGIDDPNVIWNNYQTALGEAVEKSNVDIVQDLLRRGANPNTRAQFSDDSVLMVAAKKGNKDIIDALLKIGANVNENHGNSISALWYAVRNKHSDVVKALLAAGADPNLGYIEGRASETILSMAIKEGLVDIVGALLESKANPNASLSVYDGSHLMEAISNGNLPIAKMLLQHGANINTYIPYTNSTPLSIAVTNNKEDAVKFLIENGADVNATLAFDRTVLDQAYYFKMSPNIIKLLLDAGGQARHEKGSAVVSFGNPLTSKTFSDVPKQLSAQQSVQASQANNTLANNATDSKQSNSSESPPRIMVMRMLEYAMNDGGLSYESQIEQTKLQIEGLPKPTTGDKKTARRLNNEALSLFNNNDYETASKKLTEANAIDPSDVEIMNNLGYSYLKQGKLDFAEQSLITALTMSPGRATAWSNLGDVIANRGDISRAVACFSNVYRFSKNREKTYQLMKGLNENEDVPTLKQARSITIDWAKKTYPDIN